MLYDNNIEELYNLIKLLNHEIRTQLQTISGSINLFSKDTYQDNQEKIKFMNHAAYKLSHLMNVISCLSRFKAGYNNTYTNLVDVIPFVKKLELEVNNSIGIPWDSKVRLRLSSHSSKIMKFDYESVFNLLHVLFNNIRYIIDEPDIELTFLIQDSMSIINVKETAKGIPYSKTPLIHNPFRLMSTLKDKMYLGEIRIIYHVFINEILNQLNADIEIVSDGKEGVTLQIILPEGYDRINEIQRIK